MLQEYKLEAYYVQTELATYLLASNDKMKEKGLASQSSISALLRKRRQVYGFKARPVPEKVLTTVLEDAIHVPSAGFTQDFDALYRYSVRGAFVKCSFPRITWLTPSR